MRVYLVYSNSKTPLSPVIRWRTKSAFSHVGIILESGEITRRSLVSHSALSTKGVCIEPLAAFIDRASEYRITALDAEITQEQFNLLVYMCQKYVGTPYDLLGAIGLGFGVDWQADDKFWCSEWVAWMLKNIGMRLQYLNDVHRIAPRHNLDWPQSEVTCLQRC